MPEIATAPDWLVEIIRSAGRAHRPTNTTPVVELDQPEAIARAVHWLENNAPLAVEGDGGDITTYRVACAVGDFGLSESATVDALLDHWNERCEPPWDPAELADKVRNAVTYRTAPIGRSSAAADFEAVEILEPLKKRSGLYLVPFSEAADTALDRLGDPLVEAMIDQESMVVMYGDSNSGKTFVMLDIAFHIASGRPWQGRETSKGVVVYIAAEGGRGIFKRVRALRQHYDVQDCPLYLIPCPVNLLSNKADIEAVIRLVREAETAAGAPARLVVIDTLSRALAGGDENTSTDMGAFVRNVDRIRDNVKACITIVHHSGKDAARGARGWSGLRAATDTEIEIGDNEIRTRKQRDMEPGAPMKFRLEKVALGDDQKGRPVTSAVIQVVTGSEFMEVELSPEAQEMLDAFECRARAQVRSRGAPIEEWAHEIVTREGWEQEYISLRNERITRAQIQPMGESETMSACIVSDRHMRRLRTCVIESGHVAQLQRNQYVKTKRP